MLEEVEFSERECCLRLATRFIRSSASYIEKAIPNPIIVSGCLGPLPLVLFFFAVKADTP